jgi:hypothetical protein
MTKLEEYFEQDCGAAEAMSLYEAYEKGYNRTQIENLESQLIEARMHASQIDLQTWLNNIYTRLKYEYLD